MHVFSFSQVKLLAGTPIGGIDNTIKKLEEMHHRIQRNLGCPNLGNREHVEGLFTAFKHDPEGKMVQRTQWQQGKGERFRNGKTINLRCETGANYHI